MRTEVDGNEIEEALETRAYNEILNLAPGFTEWLCDEAPRMAQIVGKLMHQPGDLEAMLLLSLLKNDYISHRKYEADPFEQETIAGYILDAEREGVHDY